MIPKTQRAGRLFAIFLMLVTAGCDRVTKHIATATLSGATAKSYLADTLRLEYAENSGAFLSLGSGLPDWIRTGVLTIGAGFAVVAVAIAAVKLRWTGAAFTGAMLFVSGGASNLADRISRGSVVDFLNFGFGTLRTGIFNIADVGLIAGVVLMTISQKKG